MKKFFNKVQNKANELATSKSNIKKIMMENSKN